MNIEELSTASGVSVRNIKRFISLGLVTPAIGRTRGARYNQTHLDDLERVKRAQEQGQKVGDLAKTINRGAHTAPARNVDESLNLLVLPINDHSYLVLDREKSNLDENDRRRLLAEVRRAVSGFLNR